jgi:hypothetical protein
VEALLVMNGLCPQVEEVSHATSYKGVIRVLQGCYKDATRMLQGRYKGVTRVLQGCYKIVTRVL